MTLLEDGDNDWTGWRPRGFFPYRAQRKNRRFFGAGSFARL